MREQNSNATTDAAPQWQPAMARVAANLHAELACEEHQARCFVTYSKHGVRITVTRLSDGVTKTALVKAVMPAPDMLTLSRHVRPGTVAYDEHVRACQRAARAGRGRADFARAMGTMLRGWSEYAEAYAARYGGDVIGDDAVLGDAWAKIGDGLRDLLNPGPELGGLDAGSIDANILDCMARNGAGEVEP